ncbi:MAG TPA: hypothetical protein PK173_10160, partial [Dokdonella sp.]|nr:hypothetical protein [Dokdonella sp.]
MFASEIPGNDDQDTSRARSTQHVFPNQDKVRPRSLRGRSHPAATPLPSIDWINRQACIVPAMR